MDMLTVNLTDIPNVNVGERVELWGNNLAVEEIAKKAGTIAYELICQVSPRVRENTHLISCSI
jgi:alanine racemase